MACDDYSVVFLALVRCAPVLGEIPLVVLKSDFWIVLTRRHVEPFKQGGC